MRRTVPFIEEEYADKGAAEIANWATKQDIEGFPDKWFGSFVWKVVESKDNDTLVEAQHFFSFSASSASCTARGPTLQSRA